MDPLRSVEESEFVDLKMDMFVFETMQSAHGSSYSIREFHHWLKDLYLQMRNESFFRWFLIGAYHLIAIDKEPCSFYHNLFVSICF